VSTIPEQAIAKQEDVAVEVVHDGAGTLALAQMSEGEFERRLADLKKGQARIRRIKTELMEAGVHYGVIPGTKKPTLLKPGAEVLCSIFGLRLDFMPTKTIGDGVTSPTISIEMRSEAHLGSLAGPVVGVGYGAANSWETKHRYRRSERACPACGTQGSVRRSQYVDKQSGEKGWYCRENSCKAQFQLDDPTITDQQSGQQENENPFELENTLLKMCKKRAQIDVTLLATASSDLFTQDVEDKPDPPSAEPEVITPQRSASPKPSPPPAAAGTAKASANGKAKPICPRCKKAGGVIHNRKAGHGWHCWKQNNGCGYSWDEGDQAIHEAAAAQREENHFDEQYPEPGTEG
jgi:hypothetical protein